MSEWRAEILRKRLGNIMKEWARADRPTRTELMAEALLIWRDLMNAGSNQARTLKAAN